MTDAETLARRTSARDVLRTIFATIGVIAVASLPAGAAVLMLSSRAGVWLNPWAWFIVFAALALSWSTGVVGLVYVANRAVWKRTLRTPSRRFPARAVWRQGVRAILRPTSVADPSLTMLVLGYSRSLEEARIELQTNGPAPPPADARILLRIFRISGLVGLLFSLGYDVWKFWIPAQILQRSIVVAFWGWIALSLGLAVASVILGQADQIRRVEALQANAQARARLQ